jgi:hypothetical protein
LPDGESRKTLTVPSFAATIYWADREQFSRFHCALLYGMPILAGTQEIIDITDFDRDGEGGEFSQREPIGLGCSGTDDDGIYRNYSF